MSQQDDDLSALIRRHGTRHRAPDALRAAVRANAALADAGRIQAPKPVPPRRFRAPRWLALDWRPAFAGFALGLVCMALAFPLVQRWRLHPPMAEELVAEHVEALRVGPLTQVASSDQHTVKPWFQGKLDYAPPVFDFAGEGYPLVGGRLERVRGNTVAALAYMRRKHVMNVFVWPSATRQMPTRTTYRGFNVVHWSDGAMEYWAVSDLDAAELVAFAGLCEERATGR